MTTERRTHAGCQGERANSATDDALLAAWVALSAGLLWLSLWVTRPGWPPAAVSRARVALEATAEGWSSIESSKAPADTRAEGRQRACAPAGERHAG